MEMKDAAIVDVLSMKNCDCEESKLMESEPDIVAIQSQLQAQQVHCVTYFFLFTHDYDIHQ